MVIFGSLAAEQNRAWLATAHDLVGFNVKQVRMVGVNVCAAQFAAFFPTRPLANQPPQPSENILMFDICGHVSFKAGGRWRRPLTLSQSVPNARSRSPS